MGAAWCVANLRTLENPTVDGFKGRKRFQSYQNPFFRSTLAELCALWNV